MTRKNTNPTRPFRLWNPKTSTWFRWRCYASKKSAIDHALVLVNEEKVDTVIEIIDLRGHRWISAYRHSVDGIMFLQPKKFTMIKGGKHGQAA